MLNILNIQQPNWLHSLSLPCSEEFFIWYGQISGLFQERKSKKQQARNALSWLLHFSRADRPLQTSSSSKWQYQTLLWVSSKKEQEHISSQTCCAISAESTGRPPLTSRLWRELLLISFIWGLSHYFFQPKSLFLYFFSYLARFSIYIKIDECIFAVSGKIWLEKKVRSLKM